MTAIHIAAATATPSSLNGFLGWCAKGPGDDFADFERLLHGVVMRIEAEVLREALCGLDIDAPPVRVGDTGYWRVLRCAPAG